MVEPLTRIRALLNGLVRREQRLLLARGVLRGVAVWSFAWLALAAAVSFNRLSPAHGPLSLAGAALLGTVALLGPLRMWREAADLRRQATRVEALDPSLRGELLLVLDRASRPLGSPALIARVASRTADHLQDLRPEQAHPGRVVRRSAGAALLAVALLGLAALLLPVGPIDALAALVAPVPPVAVKPVAQADGPRALLGDVSLRYLYPTYTGLEPLDVPNSSGEIHAPPGTRVEIRARTAVAYASAVFEVYDAAPEPVELVSGRDLSAAFTVAGPGIWRFRFGDLPSPDYRIVPDPDLPPDVSVDVPRRQLTLAADQALPLKWSARDDYGIRRVVIEVKQGTSVREVELRKPLDAARTLGDVARNLPADLGLQPGDKATLRVGAWDNDDVSGSKAGWSAPIEVEVVGPGGAGQRAMENRRKLRDTLVTVLADFLVEPAAPVAQGAAGPAWTSVANTRFEAFDALVQEIWGGVEGTGIDYGAVKEVNGRRRELLGFTHGLSGGALGEKDKDALTALHGAQIESIEGAILVFDQILRQAAAARMADLAEKVAQAAEELKKDFADLSKDAALARLDRVERLLQQLMAEAAKTGDAAIEEYVNQRGEQLQALMDEVRKAIAEGRMEDARRLMERLAQQMDDLAKGLQESQQQQSESSDKLKQAMEQLQAELAQLEKDQAALRKQAEDARSKFGQDMERAVSAWEEAEKRASGVVAQLETVGPAVGVAGMPSVLPRSASDALAESQGVLDSVRARDLQTALGRLDRAQFAVEGLDSALQATARRSPTLSGALAGPHQLAVAQLAELQKVREILERMMQRQTAQSPQLQQELQRLAQGQQALHERAQTTQGHAAQVARSLPMKAPGLERGATQGAEQSERAAQAMAEGDPMGAEGGARAAEDGFRQAQDALDQAKENLQQMQQAAQQSGQKEGKEGEGKDNPSGNDPSTDPGEVVLPAPEEFQTPEAYRDALLRGMAGEVPEEYRGMNRRYYEELVRQ